MKKLIESPANLIAGDPEEEIIMNLSDPTPLINHKPKSVDILKYTYDRQAEGMVTIYRKIRDTFASLDEVK
jgi:hypothetical protein